MRIILKASGAAIELPELIDRQKPGHTLERSFYLDHDIFAHDQDLLDQKWRLVDHASRIPHPGDRIVVDLSERDSYIIVRGADQIIRAFHNVCRHRGSRLSDAGIATARLIVCPYHAWSYELDGKLKSARAMPSTFEPEEHGLIEVAVQVLAGLIFVSPEATAAEFESEYGAFSEVLDFHGITGAKIAARQTYPTRANWKLVVENFLECYHCAGAHPEYSAVHGRAKLEAFGAGPGSGDPAAVDSYAAHLSTWKDQVAELGHPTPLVQSDHTANHMAQMSRTPIGTDRLSETLDGELACTRLLGRFRESDGGQTAFGFSPLGYLFANCDFAVMLTFRPRGQQSTDVEAVWLVHPDAVEGSNYDVETLMKVWDTTLRQDKTITEANQSGVSSRAYQPGPYALSEARVDTFIRWYLDGLSKTISSTAHGGHD